MQNWLDSGFIFELWDFSPCKLPIVACVDFQQQKKHNTRIAHEVLFGAHRRTAAWETEHLR